MATLGAEKLRGFKGELSFRGGSSEPSPEPLTTGRELSGWGRCALIPGSPRRGAPE